MKNLTFLFIVLFFTYYFNLTAQVTQQWVARYNGPGNNVDQASAIAVDASGNVFVTGKSKNGWTKSNFDYATVKYNSNGVQQWVAIYNGPDDSIDVAVAIALDAVGNVYVTGYSRGIGTYYDYATIKYNPAGIQQWVARYNGPANGTDMPVSIKVDGSGNVYVTGSSQNPANFTSYATVKYNSSGVQQWAARYDGYLSQAVASVIDNAGNVYVTGDNFLSTGKAVTVKFDSSGSQQWAKVYANPGNNGYSTGLVIDGAGNIYMSGYYFLSGYEFSTVKYNQAGTQVWASGGHGGFTTGITIDASAILYVIGAAAGMGSGNDYITEKIDSAGLQYWASNYNGPASANDVPQAVTADALGNVYVTGVSTGVGTNYDYATVKYNSSGVQQWVERYNGPGDSVDFATAIAVDGAGNVYVTGYSYGNGTDFDYATIKYSQGPNGIQNNSNNIPNKFELEQNYPNPFNPSTKIRFQVPRLGAYRDTPLRLVVYDILGKEVATLVNEPLAPGSYEISFDASKLTSGLYFYKLISGTFTQTKKMVLLK